eukprot:3409636-Amphidinium_carterae.1
MVLLACQQRLWDLALGCGNAFLQCAGRGLAIALVLLIQLLLLTMRRGTCKLLSHKGRLKHHRSNTHVIGTHNARQLIFRGSLCYLKLFVL